MSQSSEYDLRKFARWWVRVPDYRKVMKRGGLVGTGAGRLAHLVAMTWSLTYLLLNLLTIWVIKDNYLVVILAITISALAYPLYVAIFTILILSMFQLIWKKPRDATKVREATSIFSTHPGVIIAVAGSFGKTTLKELLAMVFSSEKKVAFTEGNRNTLLSIAEFAKTLQGDEEYVIVEFGEGQSGDIARMTGMVKPKYAIVTGLAPNHLDGYMDVEDIATDFKSLVSSVGYDNAFINGDSGLLFEQLSKYARSYTALGCLNRWVENEKLTVSKSSFTLMGCEEQIKITSGLIGHHNITALAFVASFARELGISAIGVCAALKGSKPYEHRLEPRPFHGAWLIDDTYNGSIEGMKAGLELLNELSTKGRKIYVTPGLVDQGDETERVHKLLGGYIADAQPDALYLMKNSVSELIQSSALAEGFSGRIKIVDEPLKFYQSLETIVAAGDIVMCQNDWPDYYN